MSALKEIYSPVFYDRLAKVLENNIPSFNTNRFLSKVFISAFQNMELKERMRHTTLVLHEFMPESYPDAVQLIFNIIEDYRNQGQGEGLAFIFLPD
ncbi:HEAT domain containing protein [Arcticibacter svalbardensis MN12-7]|uniref:HEAT domain containing protein n=1 Tax=Arcticibacter svalbardensis MN12-7 TaxID=1150600 RepID=R9GMS7_9SPHI|nr:hypothetical protein [Arcticibacter svalbardensis]EOR93011.1 HEAT domain containing protein [Arcticibacter svalbardensis MN12-7]